MGDTPAEDTKACGIDCLDEIDGCAGCIIQRQLALSLHASEGGDIDMDVGRFGHQTCEEKQDCERRAPQNEGLDFGHKYTSTSVLVIDPSLDMRRQNVA